MAAAASANRAPRLLTAAKAWVGFVWAPRLWPSLVSTSSHTRSPIISSPYNPPYIRGTAVLIANIPGPTLRIIPKQDVLQLVALARGELRSEAVFAKLVALGLVAAPLLAAGAACPVVASRV
jgi:hypothetical protein